MSHAWTSEAASQSSSDGKHGSSRGTGDGRGNVGLAVFEGKNFSTKTQHFRSCAEFTRWLFRQERGAVNPWATIVIGWEEAKPCMQAIIAVTTGAIDSLRVDAKRPPLPPPVGLMHPEQKIQSVVAHVTVLVGSCVEECRARKFARRWASSMSISVRRSPRYMGGSCYLPYPPLPHLEPMKVAPAPGWLVPPPGLERDLTDNSCLRMEGGAPFTLVFTQAKEIRSAVIRHSGGVATCPVPIFEL
uniref:Uncharacterized protein n=1 Tax=Alexandrium monilatum TaxID=311494 RepID=A0A7S4PXC2_9DINO